MRQFLSEHASIDPVSFHMPGHKGAAIFRKYGYGEFLDNLVDCDVTEIPGADNLFQPEGIILDVMEKYAGLYDVAHSYLLVNGTSGGLIASILAAVRPGGKLIMARNCHKSVFNALTLGGIRPVYARPDYMEEHGIMGAVPPEEIKRCIEENPDADAVILPSPNYYGICSDIRQIAEIAHGAGMTLIVDQAHGAHLQFFHKYGCGEDMPQAAEACGADIVVNSIHKTLASLTQSAVLNYHSHIVDRYVLEDKLQAIQSTSPSYVLMSFLDINADLLLEHGPQVMTEWREAIDSFYEEAPTIKGLKLMKAGNMDRTKINLDMGALGIDGARLEQLLMEDGIFPELYTGNILMLMTGIGNTKAHMDRTLESLRRIAADGAHAMPADEGRAGSAEASDAAEPERSSGPGGHGIRRIPVPGRLFDVPMDKGFLPLEQAEGRICAGSIIPYPPGIPLVCPGEEITGDIVRYVMAQRAAGEKVIGVNDRGEVLVGA